MIIDAELVEQLKERLALHKKMKGVYFFTPPTIAGERRRYEKAHSRELLDFSVDDLRVMWEQIVECSCKNVYYKSIIMMNGVNKDIRAIKKCLRVIAASASDAMRKAAVL